MKFYLWNKKRYKLRLILVLVFVPLSIFAKTVNYEDLADSLKLQLRLTSHVLIVAENDFSDSNFFSLTEGVPLAFFYNNTDDTFSFYERLKNYSKNRSQIIILTKEELEVPDVLQTEVIFCNPENIDHLVIRGDSLNSDTVQSILSTNELLHVTIANSERKFEEQLFTLWKTTGKLPNFISINSDDFRAIRKVVSKLNNTSKIFGEVYEDSLILSEIYWENNPGVKTYGYFSFPLIFDTYNRLIPYKAGYRFSPDIIYQSGSNRNDIKTFNAIKHDPDFELNDYFIFDNGIKNKKRDNEFITKGVSFEHDAKHKDAALFENKAYIDAGPQSKKSLTSNFSIIAWVKPTELGTNNSILGKGNNFVLKIHNGKLTFTMAGIKDYISENSPIPVNVWTQVAMVYSKFHNRIDFYINGKHTEQIKLLTEYEGSDYTLLIGSNLWEEFFVGYLGNIKIWERELNEKEVNYQYLQSTHKNLSWNPLAPLVVFMIVALLVTYVLRKKNRRRTQPSIPRKNFSYKSLVQEDNKGERLFLFGRLKILNKNGDDISQKLSPKLKQLFALIFVYSHSKSKGISSKQLTEILWPGMSTTNAKNARGTYIQNLRTALSSFEEINLVFSNKLWYFEINEGCYNEYDKILKIFSIENVKQSFLSDEGSLNEMIAILKRGRFLSDIEESWFDPFVENINNQIIEFCISMFDLLDNKRHIKLINELVDIIFVNDPLNEMALHKKVRLLVEQGKLGFARGVYDNFTKLYKELYKEKYPIDFNDLIVSQEMNLNERY